MQLIYENFQAHLYKNLNVLKLQKIAVALSGGADSMCLTFLLNTFCKLYDISLLAITVNHKLRKDSTLETRKVAKNLIEMSIKHDILNWEHQDIDSSIQNRARNARYKLLANHCKNNDIDNLFVAHTYDDQAETILLRIIRGSGIDGISGMNFFNSINGINILRPLLIFRKRQIIEFLHKEKLTWIEDPSNKDNKFHRIKIRRLIASFDKEFHLTERLNLLSSNAERTKNFIHTYVIKIFKQYCNINYLGFIAIKKSDFNNLEEEIKFRLINYIIRYIKNNPSSYPIRLKSIKHLTLKLKDINNSKYTLSTCKILMHNTNIYFYKESNFVESTKNLDMGYNQWDYRYSLAVNSHNFIVTRLTKILWGKFKPKSYAHDIPADILFSTPIVYSKFIGIYIIPFINIFSISSIKKLNIKITITHLISKYHFEIVI